MSLHKGTPVVYSGQIRIFHDDLNKSNKEFASGGRRRRRRGRELYLFFDPSDETFEREEPRYYRNLDGSDFDPKNVLVHDWEVMVGESLTVNNDWRVVNFGEHIPSDLSKAGHILDLKPTDWGKFYDMEPMECWVENDGTSIYLNGFQIHLNDVDFATKTGASFRVDPVKSPAEFLEKGTYHYSHFTHYIPGEIEKGWKDQTLKALHKAVELYRKKVDEEVGNMQMKRFGAVIEATKAMPTPGGK